MKKNLIVIVIVIAVFVMASCTEKKTYEGLNGEWSVVAIDEMVIPDSIGAFIGFDTSKQIIYGSTGCNHFTGTMPIEIKPKTLIFGTVGSTRKMCCDMTIEDAMLGTMALIVDFSREGNLLRLLDDKGVTLISLEKR